MKTINQRGMTLRQYDEQRRNGHIPPADEFEDDAEAILPSRIAVKTNQILENAWRPKQPRGVVQASRSFVRYFGYALVFVMYGIIGIVAIVIGAATSPNPNAPIPTAFVLVPPVLGALGVIVQYKINRHRQRKQQERLTRRR